MYKKTKNLFFKKSIETMTYWMTSVTCDYVHNLIGFDNFFKKYIFYLII